MHMESASLPSYPEVIMQSPIKFMRSASRGRIMSLMILVAFSAVAIWLAMTATELYHLRTIRAQRLSVAAAQAKLRELVEQTPNPSTAPIFNAGVAQTIRYHGDLERKYLRGAAEPKAALLPDPPEPPYP